MTVPEQSLQTTAASVSETDAGMEIRLRLRNDADRALHYVADVRSLDYEPTTRKLTVRLSDEGRVIVPGMANVHPTFRYIDPGSEAEITLNLPAQITKLAPSTDADRTKVAFEQLRIADASEVRVEIAWADVPFYADTRPSRANVMPAVQWQQHRHATTITAPSAS